MAELQPQPLGHGSRKSPGVSKQPAGHKEVMAHMLRMYACVNLFGLGFLPVAASWFSAGQGLEPIYTAFTDTLTLSARTPCLGSKCSSVRITRNKKCSWSDQEIPILLCLIALLETSWNSWDMASQSMTFAICKNFGFQTRVFGETKVRSRAKQGKV